MWDVSQCHAATQQVCRGRVSFKTHCTADRQRGTSTKHCCYAPHWLLWQPTGKTFPQWKRERKTEGRCRGREERGSKRRQTSGWEGEGTGLFLLVMYYFLSIRFKSIRKKASEIWGAIRGVHQRRGGELQASTQWYGSETWRHLHNSCQLLHNKPAFTHWWIDVREVDSTVWKLQKP